VHKLTCSASKKKGIAAGAASAPAQAPIQTISRENQ